MNKNKMKKNEHKNLKKKLFFIFGILLIILFSFQAFSIGLAPSKIEYEFYPNRTITKDFLVFSGSQEEIEVKLKAEVDPNYCCKETVDEDKLLLDNIEITPNNFYLKPGETKNVHVSLKMPEKFKTPGNHVVLIRAQEYPISVSGTIGAVSAVRSVIIINVPYPGKYIKILKRDVPNIGLGEKLPISLVFSNKGTETIDSLLVNISIFNQNQTLLDSHIVTFNSINPNENKTLSWTYDSTKLPAGIYLIQFNFDYDSLNYTTQTTFKIGDKTLFLMNYTSKISLLSQSIVPFDVVLENEWNQPINNVFCEIYFYEKDKNTPPIVIKTPPENFNPWQKKTLSSFLNLAPFHEGIYDGKIRVYYDNQYKEYNISVFFSKEQKEGLPGTKSLNNQQQPQQQESLFTPKIVLISLLIVVILVFLNFLFLKYFLLKK